MTDVLTIDDPDSVHLVFAKVDATTREQAKRLNLLDAHEGERLRRYRDQSAAAQYLVGRTLLRVVVGDALRIDAHALRFDTWCAECQSHHGKPRLVSHQANGGLVFSVSHVDSMAVVALSRRPVGVDIEPLARTLSLGELSAVATEYELAQIIELEESDRSVGLLRAWTRKEAVLKALGHGLSVDPAGIEVSVDSDEIAVLRSAPRSAGDLAEWRIIPLRPVGHVGAVAIRSLRPQVAIWDATEAFRGLTKRVP